MPHEMGWPARSGYSRPERAQLRVLRPPHGQGQTPDNEHARVRWHDPIGAAFAYISGDDLSEAASDCAPLNWGEGVGREPDAGREMREARRRGEGACAWPGSTC